MQPAKVLFVLIIAIITLVSCAPSYRETLNQKLEGKTPNQKRAILAEECRDEIQNGLKPHDESNVRHFSNIRKICEEMTGKQVNVQGLKK